jgi:hypothetical protein
LAKVTLLLGSDTTVLYRGSLGGVTTNRIILFTVTASLRQAKHWGMPLLLLTFFGDETFQMQTQVHENNVYKIRGQCYKIVPQSITAVMITLIFLC